MRMRSRTVILAGSAVGVALGIAGVARSGADAPKHRVPTSKDGNLVVALCDGETTMEVAGVKEGDTMPRAQAQSVADKLMDEWRRKNPDANWRARPMELAQAAAPAPPGEGLGDKPDGRIDKPVG